MSGKKAGKGGAVIIRRGGEEGGHGHHGGAWKVAYADFVTAMMAFFLLMWLLNATSEEQRRGIADYFAPANIFGRTLSGAGQPFGGSSMTDDNSQVARAGTPSAVPAPRPMPPEDDTEDEGEPYRDRLPEGGLHPQPNQAGGQAREAGPRRERAAAGAEAAQAVEALRRGENRFDGAEGAGPGIAAFPPSAAGTATEASARAEAAREEQARFEETTQAIRQAIEADARLAEFGRQLSIDASPEGLRIQLLDEERRPMFALGGAAPNEAARGLVAKLAPILASLPNALTIAGHTDAAPFRGTGRSNFDLSADRANAVRRLLTEAGLPERRVRSVTGNADRDLLLPAEPLAPANRRIAIVVLREAGLPLPGDAARN
ncbi:MAG: OmpA family protein [Acetobacteraceae bacterium]|nr:OmpA family protein [Acetobacteraceae bacterium]